MKQTVKKLTALFLSFIMMIGVIPATAFAAIDYDEQEGDYYNVVQKKDWELAPGITESEIVLNSDAGDRRQVMHVVEVDMDNEYTKVIPSSKGMTPTPGEYGVQTMDLQAAYAEENGYGNVVAAMNISLSWYDSTYYDEHPELVGEPLGYLVLDGVQYTNSKGQTSGAQTCLVINFDEKDGVARPDDIPKTQIRSTSDEITGWEEQVIPANFGFLVKDGKMVNTTEEHTSEGASRSMLGIKEDGSIVMVMNDGRQAPYSTGFNNYEMSEAMLKLGCVYAINGDGGGSSQFLSQRPGEELTVNCSPSDGALRATTHGVLVISTAPSTGEFVRAHVETENQYYTPSSSVQFSATGTDLAGAAAEIPEDAYWQLADDSMGTIDSNGLFVSNGKVGEVTAQLMHNGEVKGSSTINVVVPDSIAFGDAEAYTVPFGESTMINVTAKYGVYDVVIKSLDYTITVDNSELGTLSGNQYTANETEGTTNITVTLNANEEISKTIPLTVGKGSEVIFSFEEGTEGADLSNWVIKDHEGKYTPYSDISIVTSENGMVHNGESALAVHMPNHEHVNGSEGYAANSITWVGDRILLENATAIGMWVYIPEEATQTEIALNYVWYNASGVQQRTTPDLCLNDYFNGNEYSGWHYLSVPISKSVAYIEDATAVAASQGYKRNFFLKFYVTNSGNAGDESSYMGDITYYIDDVTVDYSDAVDDRVAPVFTTTYVKDINVENDTTLTAGNTANMNNGTMNFSAMVSDNVAIDAATANVYVDGKAVITTYKNGRITSADVNLGVGVHRIVYEIADTMGNVSKAVRYIIVDGTDTAISVVPHNPDATVALTGSVSWVDVVASEAEKVNKLTLKLDLDTMHSWELENAELAYNYDIEYYYESVADEKDNMVTVVLTNNGSDVTGDAVIASLPIRVWSYCGNEASSDLTPAEAWTKGIVPAVSVNVEVEQGEVIYGDNSSQTFSAEKIHIDTEAYIHQYKMDKEYYANNTYHVHTAVAIDDVAATCTTNGYTGRTFCEGCNSVVEWGTTEKAFGHDYKMSEGVLSCTHCKDKYNGELDGKTYINGVIADGWVDDTYYYVDGVKLTGSHFIEGKMYTFDDAGVYLPDYKYDGFYEINDTVMYFVGNEYLTGNQRLGGEYYNFYDNGLAYDGEIVINGTTCIFDNGVSVPDETVKLAGICGPDAQFVLYQNGKIVITGSGPMTDYNTVGNIPWYEYNYRAYITTVEIGEDITTVGQRAFHNSPKIDTVIFKGTKVTKINAYAFGICTSLKTLILPEGVKSIAGAAFHNAPNLEYVYVPASVTSIGGNAFKYSAEKVTLGVIEGSYAQSHAVSYGYKTEIIVTLVASGTCGDSATWELYSDGELVISGTGAMTDYTYHKFGETAAPWAGYREDIKKVTIGKGIESLSDFAFYNCTNLTAVEFEAGSALKNIGSGAFGYTGIITITIPATVKSIENNAFYFSGSLETVAFEEDSKLSSIGNYAFRNCTSLKSVYIPDSVTSIGTAILYACGEKATMNVAEGTYGETYANGKGYATVVREAKPSVLYDGTCGDSATWELYDNGVLVISGTGAMTDYTYHKTGATAAPWAGYRASIQKVVIGKGIESIADFAFYNCTNLTAVEFEAGSVLKNIGIGSFGYTGIKTITIPATVKTIENNAFYFSASLEFVAFEENSKLSSIGNYAFRNCTSLKSVYIPDSVISIGAAILYACGEQATMNVAEGTYGETYANGKGYATVVREPAPSVLYDGTCGETATWELYDNGVLVISGTGAMTDYTYHKYGETAAPWAGYRASIQKVVIGKGIESIADFAFYNCTNLTVVEFEAGSVLKNIGAGAFGYTGIVAVTIPATVEEIENNAFYFSASLEIVTVEENSKLATIGNYAFRNCTSLKSISIPSSVTKIGAAILYACGDQVTVYAASDSYAYKYAVSKNYNVEAK